MHLLSERGIIHSFSFLKHKQVNLRILLYEKSVAKVLASNYISVHGLSDYGEDSLHQGCQNGSPWARGVTQRPNHPSSAKGKKFVKHHVTAT